MVSITVTNKYQGGVTALVAYGAETPMAKTIPGKSTHAITVTPVDGSQVTVQILFGINPTQTGTIIYNQSFDSTQTEISVTVGSPNWLTILWLVVLGLIAMAILVAIVMVWWKGRNNDSFTDKMLAQSYGGEPIRIESAL